MTLASRIKYAIRLATAHGLYYLGLMQLWQWLTLRRRAVVLTYHRVLSDEEIARTGSHPAIIVHRDTFARQMALLRRRFVVLSPQEFARRIADREPFPNSSCLITFDDGWRDTFTTAWPVLREQGLPALVFLPVNYIGANRLFWREALTHLVARALAEVRQRPDRRHVFEGLFAEFALAHLLDLPDQDPRASISEAVGRLKETGAAGVERLIGALAAAVGVRAEEFAAADGFVDWVQVTLMSKDGLTFGGHGAEHRLLTHVPLGEARAEIDASRTVIDKQLREPVHTFSYPNGNWAPDIADQVKAAGFRLAFTTQPGTVSCDDDPFSLRRVNIHEDMTRTTPMFLARLVGLF